MKTLPVVDCSGCGACCMTIGTPPFVAPNPETVRRLGMMDEALEDYQNEPDWAVLMGAPAEATNILADYEVAWEAGEIVRHRSDAGLPCLWFDPQARTCKFYDHRPHVCRDYEVGSDDCLEHRKEHDVL